jgi:hypothetical protein
MFSKIFASMYDGTLVADWKALVTFQQILVLSDSAGVLDMIPAAIAARTGIPLEIIEAGIAELEKPDPYSRTPDSEGRRIERLDAHRAWGWRVVNFAKYRDLQSRSQKQEADRERLRVKRSADRPMSQPVATRRKVSRPVADVAHTEAEAEAEAEASKSSRAHARPALHRTIIEIYHELLPGLPKVKSWTPKRASALDARIRERLADGKAADQPDYWRRFFEQVADSAFLTGDNPRGWRPDLEWLIRPENFAKTIEGRYAGNSNHVG